MEEEFEQERIYAVRPNKTQIKREIQEVQELAESLVSMPEADLKTLPLESEALDAILLAKRTQKSALKRQMKYITGLLRTSDLVTLNEAFEQLRRPHRQSVEQLHQLESWRDALVSGNADDVKAAFQELIALHADFDIQHVRQLIRNAAKEKSNGKPPKSSRLIFQYLRDLD